MSEDAVAQSLGAYLLASEPSAELWRLVALGELSADEVAKRLLEERPGASAEERAELERARHVFAPPSEERRRQQLEVLLRRHVEAREGGSTRTLGVVVPMPPHRTRRWVVGLLAVAAAAVLTVWLGRPGVDDSEAFVGRYEIELDKTVATVRGDEPASAGPTFDLDGKIGIRLRPDTLVQGPVGIVVYVWDQQGRPRRLDLEPTVYETGVVELYTTVGSLGLEEGEHELVVAIGWVDALPSTWEELMAADAGGEEAAGFEVVRKTIRVVASRAEDESDGAEPR